jgi:hypothetical protein
VLRKRTTTPSSRSRMPAIEELASPGGHLATNTVL